MGQFIQDRGGVERYPNKANAQIKSSIKQMQRSKKREPTLIHDDNEKWLVCSSKTVEMHLYWEYFTLTLFFFVANLIPNSSNPHHHLTLSSFQKPPNACCLLQGSPLTKTPPMINFSVLTRKMSTRLFLLPKKKRRRRILS